MSTSLLYHAFGIREFRFCGNQFKEGRVYVRLEKKTVVIRCPVCKSKNTIKAGRNERLIRLLPIGPIEVLGIFHLQTIKCKDCGSERQEEIKSVPPRKSYSKRVSAFVVQLASHMTISSIASYLKMSWHTVKEIIKEDLRKKTKKRKLNNVRVIAIDEIAVKKNHYYMTVVTDLESGEVIYAVEGKGKEEMKPFFERLKKEKARLSACAMDMHSPYKSALEDYYNSQFLFDEDKCKIVCDYFHAVKAMNDALDQIRRQMANNSEKQGHKLLRGARFLLLMGPEKLSEKPERVFKLNRLLKLNEFLYKAWVLKEAFMLIWKQPSREIAGKFIEDWKKEAWKMGNRQLMQVVRMLERHKEDILNYYTFQITTSPLEGLINKIKVLKRMAYGYRDMEFFKLRILNIHLTKFNLSGA